MRIMKDASGAPAAMVGHEHRRVRDLRAQERLSGRTADWPIIGFSPRKQDLTLYVGRGVAGTLLKALGKHKLSGGCLYIKRLSDVDSRGAREGRVGVREGDQAPALLTSTTIQSRQSNIPGLLTKATLCPSGDSAGCTQLTPSQPLTFCGGAEQYGTGSGAEGCTYCWADMALAQNFCGFFAGLPE